MSRELDLNNLDNVDEELDTQNLQQARGDLLDDDLDPEPSPKTPEPEPEPEPEVDPEDDEQEGEETEEERAEREAQEAEEERKRRIRVPKARLDEEAAKRKKAEQELAALRAQLEEAKRQPPEPQGPSLSELDAELDTLEDKYEEAVINGEREEATKLRSQIRRHRDTITQARIDARAAEAQQAAYEQVQFDNFLRSLVTTYPELNPGSDKYNAETEAEVADIAEAFLAKGRSRVDAIDRAVKVVLGAPAKQEEKPAPKPAKRAVPAAKPVQPPPLKQAGASGDYDSNVHALPEDEFNKLTAAELRRARGDDIE